MRPSQGSGTFSFAAFSATRRQSPDRGADGPPPSSLLLRRLTNAKDLRCCGVGPVPILWRQCERRSDPLTCGEPQGARTDSKVDSRSNLQLRECRRTWAIPSVTPFPAHCQLASIAGRVARKAELSHQRLLPQGGARKVSGTCNSGISCSKQEKWTTSLWMVHGNGIPPAEGKRYSNALNEAAAWFSISILELFTSPIRPLPLRSAARDRQIYVCKSRHTLVTAQRRVLLQRATSSGGGQTRTGLVERWAEESVVSATCVFPHGTHTTTLARPTQQGGWKPQVNQATPVNKFDCSARLDHLHSSCCPLPPP